MKYKHLKNITLLLLLTSSMYIDHVMKDIHLAYIVLILYVLVSSLWIMIYEK